MKLSSTSARYLFLAVFSLALAGLYSIFLVILRSPWLSSIFGAEIFRSALVIHVNLSVLVWMLSIASSLWFYMDFIKSENFRYYVNYSNYICALAVVLMFISPIIGNNNPILNNYVPMLDNPVFIIGLVIFISGILLAGILAIISYIFTTNIVINARDETLRIGNICSILILFLAFVSCCFSYFSLDKLLYPLDLHFFYEMFFWSGGHILQFCFVEIMMVIQILLLEDISSKKLYYYNIYKILLVLNLLLVLPAFFAHFAYNIDSPEFLEFFTIHMKYCGAIAPSLMFVVVVSEYYNIKSSTSNNCLIISTILFFLGGLIGVLISGINVTIPAHYHGSIVGITIALMGYTYMMFGINNRASFYQPYIYGVGQIIHIIGLAWSGGYGVMRKSPGVELPIKAKIAMGIMGFGGLLAIIGGLIFVYICTKHILSSRTKLF